MSIVLPSPVSENNLKGASSSRFALSKTLLDAKQKLGPVYYSSKLVECPQNAIELSKLLQTYDELDKKSFKAKEENERQQRQLVHNLEARYSFTKNRSLQNQKVSDLKLPPSGFRYHSDGTPKLIRVPMVGERSDDDEKYFDYDSNESDYKTSYYYNTTYFGLTSSSQTSLESASHRKQDDANLMRVSERLINQIKKELEINESDITRRQNQRGTKEKFRAGEHKVSFNLAPHSKSMKDISKKQSIDSNIAGYSYPGLGNLRNRKSAYDFRSNCSRYEHTDSREEILKVSNFTAGGPHRSQEFERKQNGLSRRQTAPVMPWRYSSNENSLSSKHYSHLNTRKSSLKGPPFSCPIMTVKEKLSKSKTEQETSKTKLESRPKSSDAPADTGTKRQSSARLIGVSRSIPLLGHSSSSNIIKKLQKEENDDIERRVEDFLKKINTETNKPKTKPFFVVNR